MEGVVVVKIQRIQGLVFVKTNVLEKSLELGEHSLSFYWLKSIGGKMKFAILAMVQAVLLTQTVGVC